MKVEKRKKLKGITKTTIKNQIVIKDHKNAIYKNKSKYKNNYTIDSKKHHIEKNDQYKITVDPFDDEGIKGNDGSFRFYGRKIVNSYFYFIKPNAGG